MTRKTKVLFTHPHRQEIVYDLRLQNVQTFWNQSVMVGEGKVCNTGRFPSNDALDRKCYFLKVCLDTDHGLD